MSTVFQPYLNQEYRRDIQGVRATGAVLIMVYHIWLNKVSGGVDVFFVVSGFFMGGLLLRQVATEGHVAPFRFWGKIIKRIAPSAYTVLMTTLVLAYVFVPQTHWTRLVDETIASAFHLENIQLMRSSVDYLARQEPPSAVQQFWALSIQMQFYFLLPIIFIAATTLARRLGTIYPMMITVCGIIALSFVYSAISTANTPASAYFNPLARAWEFFGGVLLALVIPSLKLNISLRNLFGMLGLATLLATGLIIPKSASYPGYVSLVPVSAAALLIISGSGSGSAATAVSRFLSHRVFQFLGTLSFSIYLWHWPLLVFYLEFTGATAVSLGGGLSIMGAAIFLAFVNNTLLESPLGKKRFVKQDAAAAYLLGALFFIPAAATSSAIRLHFNALVSTASIPADTYFDQPAIEAQLNAADMPYKEFLMAKAQLPASYKDGCHQRTANPEVSVCEYGDLNAKVTVALVGGSHATQWLPALDRIGQANNLKILNITKSHCPLGALEDAHESCILWNQRVVEFLRTAKPTAVITNSTRATDAGREEYVPNAYVDQWRLLAAEGIKIIGIRDNPRFDHDVAHCVARNQHDVLLCSKPRADALQDKDPAIELSQDMTELKLVDMSDYFCTTDRCTTVFDNTLMYRDKEHLTVSYVNRLTDKLHEQLMQVAPSLFGTGG